MSTPLATSWIKIFGTTNQDYLYSLALGSNGGIYLAGETKGNLDGVTNNSAAGFTDAFVKKYNTDGTVAWTRLIGSSYDDKATAITTDTSGAIYVVGNSYTGSSFNGLLKVDGQLGNGSTDIFISKFNSDGSRVFTKLIGTNESDSAYGVSVSKSGDIYIVGSTMYNNYDGQKSLSIPDILLLKLSQDGTKVWSRLIGTTSTDIPVAVSVGSDGSVYVLGKTTGDLVGQKNADLNKYGTYDVFLTKVLPTGVISWSSLVGGSRSDYPTSIALGSDGSIYVTGYLEYYDFDGKVSDGSEDGFFIKYNQDGTKVWSKLISTNNHSAVKPNSVAIGTDSSIYVGGYVNGSNVDSSAGPATTLNGEKKVSGVYGTDAFLIKYNSDGSTASTTLYGITSTQRGESVQLIANSLGFDSADNSVYLAGYTNAGYSSHYSSIPGVGGDDPFLLKFTTSNSISKKLGTTGNDSFNPTVGDENIDGDLGIDTVILQGARSSFSITKTTTGYNVTDKVGAGGVDTLTNIERLQFTDTNIALDLSGNAGTTAKILGAVFGGQSLTNKSYVGIGLKYLDAGWTYDNLAGLALDAAGAKTNDQIVSLLWKNVIGTTATANDKAPYIAMLENRMTPGALAHLAADTSFNTTNINLIGLALTGIEYIPVV